MTIWACWNSSSCLKSSVVSVAMVPTDDVGRKRKKTRILASPSDGKNLSPLPFHDKLNTVTSDCMRLLRFSFHFFLNFFHSVFLPLPLSFFLYFSLSSFLFLSFSLSPVLSLYFSHSFSLSVSRWAFYLSGGKQI